MRDSFKWTERLAKQSQYLLAFNAMNLDVLYWLGLLLLLELFLLILEYFILELFKLTLKRRIVLLSLQQVSLGLRKHRLLLYYILLVLANDLIFTSNQLLELSYLKLSLFEQIFHIRDIFQNVIHKLSYKGFSFLLLTQSLLLDNPSHLLD